VAARRQAKRGRPRRDGSFSQESPRDAIIHAATRLFAERGYAFTTITEIATAAGLQQSSIYYWFSSKEQILQATLALNRKALDFAVNLLAEPAPASEKLYRLLRYDTLQLCLSPFDFNEIERLAEAQPADFADFWSDYKKLHRYVLDLVEEGITTGEFHRCDPELAATTALCLNEGIQKRYRAQEQHSVDSGNPFIVAQRVAREFADTSAATTLLSLMSDPATVSQIRNHVEDFDSEQSALSSSEPR
jgi:TetR/AcrR family transcriptional regulator